MGFLIAGLGNPGSKYEHNRHNIGFMLVDHLALAHSILWSRCKWDGVVARSSLWGTRLSLVKPQTFMNRSGRTIAGVAGYFDIDVENILVIHDDLDMNVGRVKLVKGGGTGGHNGIRSTVESLGTNKFYRLKIGIGRPGNSDAHPDMPVDKFVLSDFSKDERIIINDRIGCVEDGLTLLVEGDAKGAMNMLNCIK